MVMAPLFAVVVAILTALEWDFLHDHGWGMLHDQSSSIAWPSGTADGRYGWARVANFALLGLAVLGLAFGLRRVVVARLRIAPILMVGMGLCLLAASAKTDEGDSPTTWHGYVHAIASVSLFLLSVVTMFVTWRWLRDPAWSGEARVSAWLGVLALAGLVVDMATPGSLAFCFYLAALLGWIALLGRGLVRASREEATT
jgi:hypothetical protein